MSENITPGGLVIPRRTFSESDMIDVDPEHDAMLLTDALIDFMPGGGLEVPDGDGIVPIINRCFLFFPPENCFEVGEDHPPGHSSFAKSFLDIPPFTRLMRETVENWSIKDEARILSHKADFTLRGLKFAFMFLEGQTLWTTHGVRDTRGAQLHPDIKVNRIGFRAKKGFDPIVDAYDAFHDNFGRTAILASVMRQRRIRRIFHLGLIEEVCVGWSVRGGLFEGFENVVVIDGTRRLDHERANRQRRQLEDMGVIYCYSEQLRGQTFQD